MTQKSKINPLVVLLIGLSAITVGTITLDVMDTLLRKKFMGRLDKIQQIEDAEVRRKEMEKINREVLKTQLAHPELNDFRKILLLGSETQTLRNLISKSQILSQQGKYIKAQQVLGEANNELLHQLATNETFLNAVTKLESNPTTIKLIKKKIENVKKNNKKKRNRSPHEPNAILTKETEVPKPPKHIRPRHQCK